MMRLRQSFKIKIFEVVHAILEDFARKVTTYIKKMIYCSALKAFKFPERVLWKRLAKLQSEKNIYT